MNTTEIRTPAVINGYPVVASKLLFRMRDGLLPDAHIVVCRNEAKPESIAYNTWYVAWQVDELYPEGRWVAMWGHYDLSHAAALEDMARRG
jgi:hypothetical protein